MRSRLRERARVYVRHAYQAPSWALRATRSMEEIRRSPPPQWVAIPRRTDQDASASQPRRPSRPSVRQTSSDASSQASTSRPMTTANPPPTKKKQSVYDMLRAENFTDPLLGYRHAQRKQN
ncbi:4919_t:CDS:2 [Paraglomus occultum]|uniref:4919_t:CDS:1 n=1 Tax=Paraglomus occultum TaxID=144539 RepID=A0A9N9ADK4_9GLOM|nr:4919_t:CDS:2 [Paraglomus occultum]